MIYSGPENRTGQFGTGFLINNSIKENLLEVETVNDRLCKLRMKGHFRNHTIISAYAPTDEKEEEEKA